ncbi:hypothetical protein [uncultured Alistipes sp.]|uniref:DUF4405 domain-containing protein n=1 Tax=uncultured Alistipes sp. TaxID=538949 RepID=UPI00261F72D8|nr:hypothetical protein [uncultured Alistipes sp.]
MVTDRKTLLRTDRTLVPLFLLTVWSGLELHAAGHSARPDAIGTWPAVHIAASAAFTAASILHIVHHRKWYTALAGGIGGRSRMTLLLSVCFLAAALSGIAALFDDGSGPFHYKTGLLLVPVGLLHLLKQLRILTGRGSGKRVRHASGRDRSNGQAGPGLR